MISHLYYVEKSQFSLETFSPIDRQWRETFCFTIRINEGCESRKEVHAIDGIVVSIDGGIYISKAPSTA